MTTTVGRHHARLTTNDHQNTTVAVDEDQQDYNVEGDNVPDTVDLLSRRALEEHSRETDAVDDAGSWDYHCQSTDSASDPRERHSRVDHPVAEILFCPDVVNNLQIAFNADSRQVDYGTNVCARRNKYNA